MPIFWVSGISESHTVKNNLQRIFEREQYSHAKLNFEVYPDLDIPDNIGGVSSFGYTHTHFEDGF